MATSLIGAIEAGGTKFQCAVARGIDEIVASERIATTTPDETLAEVVTFFESCQARHGPVTAFGIGSRIRSYSPSIP